MESIAISGKTKICGLIGSPVEHTMSPAMHNAAFTEMGLDYRYVAFEVAGDDVGAAVAGMRALKIRGLNVTIPHKVSVIPCLDELDDLAEKIGAVNTIVNNDGVLKGYNTDASGFLESLLEKGIEPEGKSAVVLGAGGASRAISFILARRGAHLVILNRLEELDWAVELAARISEAFGEEIKALEMTEANLAGALAGADILVNATSVGMSPHVEGTPVPAGLLRGGLTIFDVVYNPLQTRLLREAEVAGARAISGVDMLIWQGVLAFEKWTGLRPPVELMRNEVMKVLKKS
ncbi:shikimate dehydrogenase [Chloroflexota bacterium]